MDKTKKTPKASVPMSRKDKMVKMSPAQKKLEKREEKLGKDLDHDGEKGESAAHRAKVFGKKAGKK